MFAPGSDRRRGMERYLLRWRTRRGRRTQIRHLDLLALALKARGRRCVPLYWKEKSPLPVPLLWVYATGAAEDAGIMVTVLAAPGGTWGYYEARRGRQGYLYLCGDTKAAAEQVDLLLKHRMCPGTGAFPERGY
ncbi:hypothetical protein [Actinomadura formosensis]|uniref:hypothetical protein n=1 Tax=Actinomadura formosensis TaxID=60706 RepID=UPI00104181A4|nr:hypothetical protein [Actinomadura formosensis]